MRFGKVLPEVPLARVSLFLDEGRDSIRIELNCYFLSHDSHVDISAFKQFWTGIFGRFSPLDIEPLPPVGNQNDVSTLWRPIKVPKIAKLKPSGDQFLGPDGQRIVDCTQFGYEVLAVLFTAIYFFRVTPKPFLKSRTVLLPKSDGATDPADFRPISLSSMLQGWLHRVIATRLGRVVDISPAQTAFSQVDGSLVNALIINSIPKKAKTSYKSVYLLSLDVRKAFDSVSHHLILPICRTNEMDNHRNYLRKLLKVGETYAMSKTRYDKYHSNQLYKSRDGAALKRLGSFPLSQNWVDKPPADLDSRRYKRMIHHRINAIPTRSRTTRGQDLSRNCRAGCLAPKTANHVSMGCLRTHPNRIKQHDRVRDITAKWIEYDGYRVIKEPCFTTLTHGTTRAMGRWRPDIFAIKGEDGVIFDAQVRAEGYDLDRLHEEKVEKYRIAPGLIETIKSIHGLKKIKCVAITFTRRGQISPKCYKALGAYFNPRQIGFLFRVVLYEDVTIWWAWNSTVRRATLKRIPHVPDPTYPHQPA
ncbi:hypothetical protein QYM36_015023 [Artemia franciscana]|uniref:Reverse transcriptase domain-containing protein n=1 Tax=Artemia franciscana TaxID=6661 RepID=A0AA88HGU8_ARTSF|nr:hypothetical protein QYM36_015023 [Artemia franciscana]